MPNFNAIMFKITDFRTAHEIGHGTNDYSKALRFQMSNLEFSNYANGTYSNTNLGNSTAAQYTYLTAGGCKVYKNPPGTQTGTGYSLSFGSGETPKSIFDGSLNTKLCFWTADRSFPNGSMVSENNPIYLIIYFESGSVNTAQYNCLRWFTAGDSHEFYERTPLKYTVYYGDFESYVKNGVYLDENGLDGDNGWKYLNEVEYTLTDIQEISNNGPMEIVRF